MLTKDQTDTIKNLIDITKQLFILGMMCWFLIYNQEFRQFFVSRGISIDLPGIKYRDQLQDANNAISVATLTNNANQLTIRDFQTQMQKAIDELQQARQQLQAARSKTSVDPSGTSISGQGLADQTVARLDHLLETIDESRRDASAALLRSGAAANILDETARRNEIILNQSIPAGWLVVFGSDTAEVSAGAEVKRAAERNLPNGVVIKRGKTFHPAFQFKTEAEAREKLTMIRQISKYATGAFPVAESAFCVGGLTKSEKSIECRTTR